ncbi:MAG: hypothetical protein IPK32_17910 [Verrucomicrobiaceae bacterium]|nr:hypothetical protein [Verrucomicrobiaceae bacterium]
MPSPPATNSSGNQMVKSAARVPGMSTDCSASSGLTRHKLAAPGGNYS